MTTTNREACLHRQRRESRGIQDLFCIRPAGHDGNHRHDTHPGGAKYRDGAWIYGEGNR